MTARRPTWQQSSLLAMAGVQLGLVLTCGWLVAGSISAGPVRSMAIGLLAVMGAITVVAPGSAAAMVLVLTCGASFLVLSAFEAAVGASARPPEPYEVLGLAAALYLVHAVDALREILPAGSTIEAAVLVTWARRVAEALVPGLAVGAAVLLLPTATSGGLLWLLGAVALLAAVAVPAIALRPRPWADWLPRGR